MLSITKHAQERYAERIMGREEVVEVNRFIVEHADKISTDINKMIEFGQVIFEGKTESNNKMHTGDMMTYIVNGCWVIIINKTKSQVVTLYKVDLGLDEEFNKQYVKSMVDKIEKAQDSLKKQNEEVLKQLNEYKDKITELVTDIKIKKNQIEAMDKMIKSYEEIIENNRVLVQNQEDEVLNLVNKLIGKRY